MTIELDKTSDRADLSGSFACTDLLELTAVDAQQLLGVDHSCSFTSARSLKIVFVQGAQVVPGDVFSLRNLVLQASFSDPSLPVSLFTVNETFMVQQPLNPTIPTASLSASSQAVGLCDGLTLDGSGSLGSGGRPMQLNYSVAQHSGSPVSLENVTSLISAANVALGGQGSRQVVIPPDALKARASYQFSLTVTNFLGFSDEKSVVITKLGAPAPVIKIQGANPVTTASHSQSLKLQATAELPAMTCVSEALSNSKMSFTWLEDSGQFVGDLADTSKNPRVLSITAGALAANATYSFRVVGFMTDNPALNNSAIVTVEVGTEPLVARIAGGAFRQVGRDSEFTLDGSLSEDPDVSATVFAYAWSCEAEAGTGANCSGATFPASASLVVGANSLPVGTYTLTLQVSKAVRSDTTSSVIEVVAGAPPAISLDQLASKKYSAADEFVTVTASVVSSSPGLSFNTEWLGDGGNDVAEIFIRSGVTTLLVADSLSAVVSLSSLSAGNTYTLVFTATDADGASGYSTLSLVMNEAPASGNFAVAPYTGYPLETGFAFSASDWVDDDLPLTYLFGTAAVTMTAATGVTVVDTTALSPFGDKRGDNYYAGVTLSQGNNATNYTVGCFTEVIDSFGFSVNSTTTVRVVPKVLSVEKLANISAAKTREHLEAGNGEAANQAGNQVSEATSASLQTTTSSEEIRRHQRRRRSLLASGDTETGALRASLLENLWATFSITPVTQPDVASLLGVLVGIVDTPSDVTAAVAAGSLELLRTVLVATLSEVGSLGISDTAAAHAGTVLSSLFETEWLTPAGNAAAADHGANVTQAVRLLSACQLDGSLDGVPPKTLSASRVALVSYRSAADSFLNGRTSVDLPLQEASVSIGASVAELASAAAGSSGGALLGSTLLDVRVSALDSRLYESAMLGTTGSAAAIASRLDQPTAELRSGPYLLRSKVTLVELALGSDVAPLSLSGLTTPVTVTLAATRPFNTSVSGFQRTFACPTDGAVIDLGCPLTPDEHTCDWAKYAGGEKYFFDYACPRVVPTCLWWDESMGTFSSLGCAVSASHGYTDGSVICECSHLTTFALGANVTEAELSAQVTPNPTMAPSPLPTLKPTPLPTPLPTYSPTNTPFSQPTFSPSLVPTNEPTLVPTPAPTAQSTPEPSPLPTLVPTALPTQIPTFPPTPEPTMTPVPPPTPTPSAVPSLAPTTVDTASVSVAFTLESSLSAPGTAEQDIFKNEIASALGLNALSIKNFELTSAAAVAAASAAAAAAAGTSEERTRSESVVRGLVEYTWTVTFGVVVSLSLVSTAPSSPQEFASFVSTQLNNVDFEGKLQLAMPSVSSVVGAVTSVAVTRAPTPASTLLPNVATDGDTTPEPTVAHLSDGDGSSSSKASAFTISLSNVAAIVGVIVLCGVIYIVYRVKEKEALTRALAGPFHQISRVTPQRGRAPTPTLRRPKNKNSVEVAKKETLGGQGAEVSLDVFLDSFHSDNYDHDVDVEDKILNSGLAVSLVEHDEHHERQGYETSSAYPHTLTDLEHTVAASTAAGRDGAYPMPPVPPPRTMLETNKSFGRLYDVSKEGGSGIKGGVWMDARDEDDDNTLKPLQLKDARRLYDASRGGGGSGIQDNVWVDVNDDENNDEDAPVALDDLEIGIVESRQQQRPAEASLDVLGEDEDEEKGDGASTSSDKEEGDDLAHIWTTLGMQRSTNTVDTDTGGGADEGATGSFLASFSVKLASTITLCNLNSRMVLPSSSHRGSEK